MAKHSESNPQGGALEIAEEIRDLMANMEHEILTHVQDKEPYQSPDMAYFRVTGADGETYYVQVSKAKRS